MNPLTANAVQTDRFHDFARRKAKGDKANPARAIRNNPNWRPDRTGGEPGPPPQPNRPTFIKMNELPHVAASNTSRRTCPTVGRTLADVIVLVNSPRGAVLAPRRYFHGEFRWR